MKAIGQRTVCREDWYGAGMDGGLNNYCPAQSESTGSRSGGGVRTLGWIVAHSTSSIENKVKVGRATSREASRMPRGGSGHRWTYEGRAARAASPQITRGGRGGEKGVGVQASVRTAMTTGAMGESTEETEGCENLAPWEQTRAFVSRVNKREMGAGPFLARPQECELWKRGKE
jgi:hypothetical protein